MHEPTRQADPRWGQVARDQKAEAILATLELHCGRSLRSGTWLDIGCGSGGIASTLAQHVERVVGVDPESWARWDDFRMQHPNLTFLHGSYRDLEPALGAESCDVVICNQVYEHVDDPHALLDAIHAVLKTGGVCYFAGPNLLWPIEPHVFWPFVHWLPRGFAIRVMRLFRARWTDYLDAWSWSYWRLTRAFRRAGFRHEVAIRDRLQINGMQRSSPVAPVVGVIPRFAFRVLAPVSPAFVFALYKQ